MRGMQLSPGAGSPPGPPDLEDDEGLKHLQQVWGVGTWIPEGCSLTPVPTVPGGCSRTGTLLCAPPHGAPGCRGRFICTPLT